MVSKMKYNKKYIEILGVSLFFIVIIVWFFREVVFSSNIFVERDLSRYYYPLRQFAVNCIKSGIFPLWNPYIFCGNPLFATLQSAVLYPVSIIYYLGDFTSMFNIFIYIHFFLAAIFTYIFLRQLGYSFFASFLSAITFCFSGYMTSTINLLTTLSVIAWFPLAILFYYKTIKAISGGKTGFSQAVMLGIIMTIMFLAGEPSVLYGIIGFFIIGSVYFFFEDRLEKKNKFNFYYIKSIFLSVAIFLGLSAFQFLPFWEFLGTSSRENLKFGMASIWSLPLKDVPAMILPFFHDIFRLFSDYWSRQSWLDNYYIGILVFILFVIGVVFDKSKKARAIFILGLAGFVLSLGKNTILFEFLYRFAPGFKAMRYTIRFFFIPTFAICCLAGIGLDYYSNFIKTDKKLKRTAFLILVAVFLSVLVFYAINVDFQGCLNKAKDLTTRLVYSCSIPRLYVEDVLKTKIFSEYINIDLINLKRLLLVFVFFGLIFFLGSKKEVRVGIFIVPCLVFLVAADVIQINKNLSLTSDAKKFTKPISNVEYLIKEYKKGCSDFPDDINKQLFRICCSPQTARQHAYVPELDFNAGLEASKDRLITNRMMEFGIYDINMYGSIYIKRNSKFMNLVMSRKSKNVERLLKLSNVKFVANSKDPKLSGFKLVNSNKVANLYQIDEYLPRAFLVGKAVVIKNEEAILTKLRDGDFLPDKEVIIENYLSIRPNVEPGSFSHDSSNITADSVKIVSYGSNKIIIKAELFGCPKFLVLTDTYYPGWKVTIDGKPGKIMRADYIFRAVYLMPGQHTVEFIYDPFSFKLGIFISLITGVIILTFAISHNIIIYLNKHNIIIAKSVFQSFFKTR